MKLIAILSGISVVVLFTTSWLVNIKPVFAASAAENTWESRASMPGAVEGGGAAVVGGKIYVMGGSANYVYDPETDTWTAKKPMPTSRQGFGIAVYQNKIYTLGGR